MKKGFSISVHQPRQPGAASAASRGGPSLVGQAVVVPGRGQGAGVPPFQGHVPQGSHIKGAKKNTSIYRSTLLFHQIRQSCFPPLLQNVLIRRCEKTSGLTAIVADFGLAAKIPNPTDYRLPQARSSNIWRTFRKLLTVFSCRLALPTGWPQSA